MGIYVEIRVRGALDEVWRHTQDPALHERWDLRFTRIAYLPRGHSDAPQRFLYETRLGFGLRVTGVGETTRVVNAADGARSSALKFWSDSPLSLIREGRGYWQYVPTEDGVRFLTWYDYETRYGRVGRLFDALIFRPVMGWATAWSFDRLRRWIERDVDPALSRVRAVVHAVARIVLAVVFLYQGLVPKLIGRSPTEMAMLVDSGVSREALVGVLMLVGVAEIVWGLALLLRWRDRWLLALTAATMPLALLGVMLRSPRTLWEAFNPLTVNLLVAAVAWLGWWTGAELPSAACCRRRRPEGQI